MPPSVSSPNTTPHSGTHFIGLHIPAFGVSPTFGDTLDVVFHAGAAVMAASATATRAAWQMDNTPNQVEVKQVDPSLGPGYDYDVCNAEVLLTRMEVRDGRIVLPDGMSYRILVLPERRTMPVEVVRKLKSLVAAGATVVGPKPVRDPGLLNYPQCDAEVTKLADEIWGDCDGQKVREHRYGKGRIFWGKPLREILQADGVPPTFEYTSSGGKLFLDFIPLPSHRHGKSVS